MIKDAVRKTYFAKGDDVVSRNVAAIDAGASELVKVSVPAAWVAAQDEAAAEEDAAGGECAPGHIVGMMNAMNYLGNPGCAKYWRIRHGAADRDTSFAVSAMLAAGLEAKGKNVDYFLPWGLPHSGDYDLEELFGWIDAVCAGEGEKE